ncbi:MAG: hypothetical protein L3K10_04295 [Thermoplasmata archaeon]|nr:hypothetical protein [Thermoplasmata archaeon]
MLLRTLLTMVNLGTIAVAIGVLFVFPQYAGVAFYILLGWMFGSLVLVYGPWSNRQVGRSRAPNRALASSSPLSPGTRAADLGFCIFCAAPLAPGAPICPSCGHSAPHF